MNYHSKENLMIPNKVVGSFIELPKSAPTTDECDVVEIRLDAGLDSEKLLSFISSCPQEKLFTARDVNEGGEIPLSVALRIELLEHYLDHADYIDVEMRNWSAFSDIICKANEKNIKTVSSYHDFNKTPSSAEMNALLNEALQTSADIIKFAFMTKNLDDISRCQELLFNNPHLKISIMGMGAYAPVSRLLLAQSGSILNYGFLGETLTAPGQWQSALLKEAITNSDLIKCES